MGFDENYAKDFYGQKEPPAPASGDSFLLGGSGNPKAIVPGEEDREGFIGGLYRENLEGDAPRTYEPVLNSFFGGKEHQARFDKDQLNVESLAAARAGANEVLTAFEVGEAGAREIFQSFDDYMQNPRSEETIERTAAETSSSLKREWGHDYEKMMSSAKRVLAEAEKKINGLMETVDRTGLGNDIKFIKRLAFIGKRRGFAK